MTKNLPVSKRIILIPLLLIMVFTLIGFGFLDQYFNNVAISRYENEIIRLARLGSQMLQLMDERADDSHFDNLVNAFAEDGRFRVTIIDQSGEALGDSQLSRQRVQEIKDLAKRPEVIEAGTSGLGICRRHSSMQNIDMLYVAVRYTNQDRKGYFRIAMPLTDLEKDLLHQRFIFGSFCLIALMVAVSLSLIASRYLLSIVKKDKQSLEQRVKKRTKEIEILLNTDTQLTACNSIEEALEVIKLGTALLLPRVTGTLALFRSSKDKLEIVESWNGQWQGEASYSPDQCWALRTGQPHRGNYSTGTIICNHSSCREEKILCIPIVAQGVTHGVLHFSSDKDMEWTPEENQLAFAVAEHASLTLANLKLRENLKQQAIRDPLTGLYNRRYLREAMDHELNRASRRSTNLGVLMLDLDHFKRFNDEHGHDTGDFILSEFSRLVRLVIRDEDIPCRYGGEEFTILLPETNRDGTFNVAEKIRKKIRENVFLSENQSYGPITLSIGAACFPENGKTADLLLKKADDALYEAKKTGRDRVVLCEIPI